MLSSLEPKHEFFGANYKPDPSDLKENALLPKQLDNADGLFDGLELHPQSAKEKKSKSRCSILKSLNPYDPNVIMDKVDEEEADSASSDDEVAAHLADVSGRASKGPPCIDVRMRNVSNGTKHRLGKSKRYADFQTWLRT